MARKKVTPGVIADIIPAPAAPQPITETIETNYMPYAMSVIISRAIPEIDGFKPAHRKLLYTMYTMGLLTGNRTKSANVVGQTMKLHPHGDASIYETMVRLTRGNEALLHPLVDSKGSFGKQYSSEMKYAASRYTEVKLESFCAELFRGIDKNAVDMVPNYDNTTLEPILLPTTFPNVLVTPNNGIAVGMASNICSFNLAEICDGTIALLKHPNLPTEKLMTLIKAPDFPCGGQIIYEEDQMRSVFETGQGSIRVRSRYRYDKDSNCIDILEIPYSTTVEVILERITELVKTGKLKEVTDFRDEIDLSGFKLTLDLRRGVDPDKLMQKLFKCTSLEDSFKCNFNVLIDSVPRQMGVSEILTEWIRFRTECVRRELTFTLGKKNDKLHLLLGLAKILLDIDKAIRIIRQTEKEEDVVPNLMSGFGIDEIQAEYIAEIKLRNLNRQYILNRLAECEDLKKEIANLKEILADELKIRAYIAEQLSEIKKKYGKPRRSMILHADDIVEFKEEEHIESYAVRLVLSKEGYFKKIKTRSLQGNDEQKFREGDEIRMELDAENTDEIMFFTDHCQSYRVKVDDFDTTKASLFGDYVPAKLGFEDGEKPVSMCLSNKFTENMNMVCVFANGKGVRFPVSNYETKSARRKLTKVFSDSSPILYAGIEKPKNPYHLLLISEQMKAIALPVTSIPVKATRTSGGVQLFTLKKGQQLSAVYPFGDDSILKGYNKLKFPASGSPLSENALADLLSSKENLYILNSLPGGNSNV